MQTARLKCATAEFANVVAVRLLPGTDITEGLQQACEQQGIRHGFLLMGIGTLTKATLQIFRPKPESRLGAGYTEPETTPGPLEILALSGIIFENEKRDLALHLHVTLCDKDGKLLGGHMVPGGNPVCATLDACIAQVRGAQFVQRYDEETDLKLFSPEAIPAKSKS